MKPKCPDSVRSLSGKTVPIPIPIPILAFLKDKILIAYVINIYTYNNRLYRQNLYNQGSTAIMTFSRELNRFNFGGAVC